MKKFLIPLALVAISFLSKAQPFIAVSSVGFTPTYNTCQGTVILVQKLKLENVTNYDSIEVTSLHYALYNGQFTTLDSIIIRDTLGALIKATRLINGSCDVFIDEYIKKFNSKYINVYIRTSTIGTGGANLSLQWVNSTYGNDNVSGTYNVWFYVGDCNNPSGMDVTMGVFDQLKNRDVQMNDTMGYNPYNTSPWINISNYSYQVAYDWSLNGTVIYQHAAGGSNNISPSLVFPIGKNKLKVVARGIGVDQGSDSIIFTVVPNKIVCTLQTMAGKDLTICPTNYFLAQVAVPSYPWQIKKAIGKVNGIQVFYWDSSMVFNNWSTFNMDLSTPGTKKIKVELFGEGQDYGADSVTIIVKQIPKIKISLSANKMCSGGTVIATLDTVGILSFQFGTFPPTNTKFVILHEGQYYLHIEWRNGCSSDTVIYITEYPAPAVPSIGSTNCQVWVSSEPGDTIVWFLNNNPIANSNKDILNITVPGIYKAMVFNQFGCGKLSNKLFVECKTSGIKSNAGHKVTISPNPTSGILKIEGYEGTITLIDLAGKVLLSQNVKEKNIIDLSDLPKGMYVLISEDHSLTRKVVKN